MELWHSSDSTLGRNDIEIGMHVGTLAQATMRRPGGILHRIVVGQPCRTVNMRDSGSWHRARLVRAARKAHLARYLNRYEGISIDDLEAAIANADESDAIFARNVPSCGHSWIILRPDIVTSIEPRTR